MASPAVPAPDTSNEFDLLLPMRSAGSLENPYPIYQLLRTVRPVMQVPVPDWDGPGAWLLTRHRDVHFTLTDPRFSADRLRGFVEREERIGFDAWFRRWQQIALNPAREFQVSP